MEQITANLLGKARKATLHGREYLVAPLSMIVPGVLTGNHGPLLYPKDEIAKSAPAWNNMPIVVQHPKDNGQSARTPDVVEAQGIGTVYKAQSSDGRLVAEGWFDVERTRKVDNRILSSLQIGQPIELSTGLAVDEEAAPQGSVDGETPYNRIARNYRPDHLAILPDQKGACSIEDGCGVLVNKAQTLLDQVTETVNHIRNTMTDDERKTLIDELVSNSCCWEEADREVLNELSDEHLGRLKAEVEREKVNNQQHEAMAAALKKGVTDPGGTTHVWNEEKQEWESKSQKEAVTNAGDKKEPAVWVGTEEEWLAQAPEGVREDLAFAHNEKAKQKQEIITHLVANVVEEQKQELIENLEAKSVEDLQRLTLLVPKPKETPTANWSGAAGAASIANAEDKFADFGLPHEYIKAEAGE